RRPGINENSSTSTRSYDARRATWFAEFDMEGGSSIRHTFPGKSHFHIIFAVQCSRLNRYIEIGWIAEVDLDDHWSSENYTWGNHKLNGQLRIQSTRCAWITARFISITSACIGTAATDQSAVISQHYREAIRHRRFRTVLLYQRYI